MHMSFTYININIVVVHLFVPHGVTNPFSTATYKYIIYGYIKNKNRNTNKELILIHNIILYYL